MELIRKNFQTRLKDLGSKIWEDNLFLLSSSVSYYSALAIAPFMLILLGVASFIGSDVQEKIIKLTSDFSPEVGDLIVMIFNNVNEGLDVASLSGIVGVVILLYASSLVFLQIRYSLDVIYGHHQRYANKSLWATILERLFAMFVVILAGVFLIVSSSLPGLVRAILGADKTLLFFSAILINLFIYIMMFWGILYFTPSERPSKRESLKMGMLASGFFFIGNLFLSSYLRRIAVSSIYGAAGTLFIFLIWTYYSSFTLFLSVEIFTFLRKVRAKI